jgi:hypothetical protein
MNRTRRYLESRPAHPTTAKTLLRMDNPSFPDTRCIAYIAYQHRQQEFLLLRLAIERGLPLHLCFY